MTSWYYVRFPTYFNLIHFCESKREKNIELKKTGAICGCELLHCYQLSPGTNYRQTKFK